MLFQRPIAIGLSPNTENDDIWLAVNMMFQPWKWRVGQSKEKVKHWFEKHFPASDAYLYNSGRSALFHILKAFGIGKGDEVIVQAFTCVAVPNSVIWNDATPVYADIDETYNLTVASIKKVVTKRTKAIIVQHTFGIPADIQAIQIFAQKEHILLIEDCAHALGAIVNGQLLGTWGDAAFFSFGRDKIISSVFGGVGIIKSNHKEARIRLQRLSEMLPDNSYWWIFQQLFHPVAFALILPLYKNGIGKGILVICQKLKLLSFPVYREEKQGKQPADFPATFPNALANLIVHQLEKLDRFNTTRQSVAAYYRNELADTKAILVPTIEGAIYLRFPIQLVRSKELLLNSKRKGILLGNWYHATIDPQGTNFSAIQYKEGSCPVAEKFSLQIVNLPTLLSEKDAASVVNMVKSLV